MQVAASVCPIHSSNMATQTQDTDTRHTQTKQSTAKWWYANFRTPTHSTEIEARVHTDKRTHTHLNATVDPRGRTRLYSALESCPFPRGDIFAIPCISGAQLVLLGLNQNLSTLEISS